MPNNKKRTTNKCSWSEESIKGAIRAVQSNNEGVRSAARRFSVPVSSLYDRLKKGEYYKTRMARHTTFTSQQEKDICQHLLQLSKMFYGLTPIQLRRAVFSFAGELSIPHRFNKDKQEAGKDWMYDENLKQLV